MKAAERIYCVAQAGGVHLAHPDALTTDCGRRIGTLAHNAELRDIGGAELCKRCADLAAERYGTEARA